eukprot:scaffold7529_cov18-Tisochrysis_lutea.AAC.2
MRTPLNKSACSQQMCTFGVPHALVGVGDVVDAGAVMPNSGAAFSEWCRQSSVCGTRVSCKGKRCLAAALRKAAASATVDWPNVIPGHFDMAQNDPQAVS